MKLIQATALSFALMAGPAFALKVTNLDNVVRTVELSGAGTPQVRVIQPNATEYFTGAAHGRLSLVEPEKKGKATKKVKPHDSVVHADGLLSGIIGNERSENIPADPDSSYTIWPGGKLNVQSRSKNGGRYF
jgi:hypothetical protein